MADSNSTQRSPRFKDLTGQKFGLWYVIGFHSNSKRGTAIWLCRCRCGLEKPVTSSNLISGYSTKCTRCARTRHGLSESPEWCAWKAMLSRCSCDGGNDDRRRRYAGRGITVCERWRTFENFLEDMGPKPSPTHSIDRIDNNGNYEPGNCRWATPKQQSRNTCANHLVTCNGRTMCLAEWSEETGIGFVTLYCRLVRHGWSPERAMTTPVKLQRSKI
jgi:hypothetical protein